MANDYVLVQSEDRLKLIDKKNCKLVSLTVSEEEGTTVKLRGADSTGELHGWGRKDKNGFTFQLQYGHLPHFSFGGNTVEEGVYSGRWSQGQTSGDFILADRKVLQENPKGEAARQIQKLYFDSHLKVLDNSQLIKDAF